MKIIGVSGTNGSGKDTLSHMLAERHGYYIISATNMLDAELKRRGWPSDRQHKSKLGDEWRREYGLGVIIDKAVEAAQAEGFEKLVVGSLRNPGEANRVHELGGTVVWVDAEPAIRYARIQNADRGRAEDQKTFEEFLAEEQAEMHQSGDEATLNMSAVRENADIIINNDGENAEQFKNAAESSLTKVVA